MLDDIEKLQRVLEELNQDKQNSNISNLENEFIEIVRIPELLEYYRSQGMPFLQYLYCKNFSLRNFFNYFIKIIIGGNKSGLKYVNFKKHFLLNLLYPYVYLSIIFYLIRKLKNIIKI